MKTLNFINASSSLFDSGLTLTYTYYPLISNYKTFSNSQTLLSMLGASWLVATTAPAGGSQTLLWRTSLVYLVLLELLERASLGSSVSLSWRP